MWTFVLVITCVVFGFLLVAIRVRERQYLKKSVKEAMSPELKKEIEEEKKLFYERQHTFEAILEKRAHRQKNVSENSSESISTK